MSQLYSRVFVKILQSSLAEDWHTRHVFEDFLKLASAEGIVDITRQAFCRVTNTPQDVFDRAIDALEAPDAQSRETHHQGRRLVRLDDHRDWGWMIVNWDKYEGIRTKEDEREVERRRKRDQRSKPSPSGSPIQSPTPTPTPASASASGAPVQVPDVSSTSPGHVPDICRAEARPCSTELPLEEKSPAGTPQAESGSGDPTPTPKVAGAGRTEASRTILDHLNTRASRSFRPSDQYLKAIDARLAEVKGDVAGVLAMIDRQVALWANDPQMAECLNPVTLFRPSKFPRYYDDRNRPLPTPGARNGGAGARPHRNDFVGTQESRAAWAAQCAAADERLVEGF